MLDAIIRGALRRPWLVVSLAVLLLLWGARSLFDARFDVFPEFVPAQAEIQVEAPGMGPEEVERRVTQPLEAAISGGANIETVRSESIQGLAALNVTFADDSDLFRDRQLLAERIAEAGRALPAGVRAPVLGPLTSSTMDLLKVGFTSASLSPIELRSFVDWTVRPRLLGVPGVARAIVYGGGRREIQIEPDPQKLQASGLTLADLATAAQAATSVLGSGYIETTNDRILLSGTPQAQTPEALGKVVVTQRAGANLRIEDVAQVRFGAEPAFGDSRVQGDPDVLLSLASQYGANTLEVTRAVEQALEDLRPELQARGVELHGGLHRPANFIEIALRHVRESLLLGALLVVAVLILFLRNWRTALISFTTIPLSLLAAVIAIGHLGWTLNTMTLGGLVVAIGVVVDDAIIDVENIARRLRHAVVTEGRGPFASLILHASLEVRRPIVLATLVVSLVFVPVLLLPGLQGSFFAPLAGAFLLATAASLVLSLTLTPALALLLLTGERRSHAEPRWLRRIKLAHARLFRATRERAWALLAVTLFVGAVSLAAFLRFGVTLLPEFREGHFVVQLTAPAGISLGEMSRVGGLISRRMAEVPGVASVSLQVGRAEAGEDTWSPNRAELHVELRPDTPGDAQAGIEEQLRRQLEDYSGFQSEVVTFLGDRISESVSGETAAMTVNVTGQDLAAVDATARSVASVLRKVPGSADVQFADGAGVPTLAITLQPDRLALLGLRPGEVHDAIGAAYSGSVVSQVFEGSQSLNVRVLLPEAIRADPGALASLPLRTVAGTLVPLAAVASIDLETGRERVSHEQGLRRQVVTLNPADADLAGFATRARAALAQQVVLPPGVTLQIKGNATEAARATRDLLLQSGVALAGIVALMLFTFGHWRPAALVLSNVPFALAGAALAVALTGATLSIGTLVGLVTLFGISARNSILLLSHYEHLVRVEGHAWNAMLARRGARERITPILMTALVTALGLLPLAIGSGEAGKEVEGPMALAILGGLVSSTLLNLVVLPVLAGRFLTFEPPSTPLAARAVATQDF